MLHGGRRRRPRHRRARKPVPSFLDLPDEVIVAVFKYCSLQSLGRLSAVCSRLKVLAELDCVWNNVQRAYKEILFIQGCRNIPQREHCYLRVSLKEQCRVSLNWQNRHCRDTRLIHHKGTQMPWMQLYNEHLWVSNRNVINCYRLRNNGSLHEQKHKQVVGHTQDVGRFVCKEDTLVSGARDGSILMTSVMHSEQMAKLTNCHSGDIQAVDFFHGNIISGSRDATVKLWSISSENQPNCLKTIPTEDRVWSLAANPDGTNFAVGTAGILQEAPPLRLWDTERTELVATLGRDYKHGAGVLDVQYESPTTLWSCGYDTFIRLWDLRVSHDTCVITWEEPFDSTVYCVKSDGNQTVVAGTARHGLVHLWDKRRRKPVQVYYSGRGSSPVYSLAFDFGHLYVGLDKGINMLDFTQNW